MYIFNGIIYLHLRFLCEVKNAEISVLFFFRFCTSHEATCLDQFKSFILFLFLPQRHFITQLLEAIINKIKRYEYTTIQIIIYKRNKDQNIKLHRHLHGQT
uniref:Uncharacterized protein n=1 Tax=Schizaphis graminum TaxID=13262 RepID=A0A2S2PN64_SCHGA